MDLYSLKASELDSLINKAQEVKTHLEMADGARAYLASLPDAVKALVGLAQPVEAVKDLPLFTQPIQPVEPVKVEHETIKIVTRNGSIPRIYVIKPEKGIIEVKRGLTTCGGYGPSMVSYALSEGRVKIAKAMQVCASEGWHLNEMQRACYCKHFKVEKCDTSNSNLCNNFDPFYFNFDFVKAAFIAYAKRERNSIVSRLNEI